ncbi:MAG: hypothetical protein M3Q45_05345, partial [Chloroflexota bacterium]|nr:hypothetical protein [Chloroflexota bacterium]
AHLLGKTFPPDYTLPAGKLNELLFRQDAVSAASYAANRGLALPTADLAWRLADRLRNSRFFQDQKAAYAALERLRRGKSPAWLAGLDALIIDEVQDLTLLQIALLGELVRERRRRRPDAPFVLTVAGDESQIVQPSGFDWGLTKDLLGEQLGLYPAEFEFQHQRRSPRNLAQLIDHTWNFYAHLPRAQRPSARRQAFAYAGDEQEQDEPGQIFICPPPPPGPAWTNLVAEVADKPGRVIVDLTETLRPTFADQLGSDADEVIFLPREIKGLERATVLVYGLNALYEQGLRLCEETEGGNIPKFEARRLFDEMRVALSRSTNKIVLLEAATAPVLTELAITELLGTLTVAWDDLIELLQLDDLSEIEAIEAYLDEVDDLFARSLWAQGYRRNRRAYSLAVQLGDSALQREAQTQYIDGHLQAAASLLQQAEWRAAHARNRQAQALAAEFGDPLLQEQTEDQYGEICAVIANQVRRQIEDATLQLRQRQYKAAYQTIGVAAADAALTQDATLLTLVDETMVAITWPWAQTLVEGNYTSDQARQAASLLAEAANALAHQVDVAGAATVRIVAERYQTLPPPIGLTASQVESLLKFVERYTASMEAHPRQPLDGYTYGQRWLEEAFANLHQQADLYYRWALVAQTFAEKTLYPALDDHLWDLEHRMDGLLEQGKRTATERNIAKFKALLNSYNGEPGAASLVWEQLGELELAVEFAREAGDMERAYALLRQLKAAIPEELAVAVKTLRLLQQLEQKYQGLRASEQQALLEQLAALYTTVAGSESVLDDTALP